METGERQDEVTCLKKELEHDKDEIYYLRLAILNLNRKKEYVRMQRMFRGGEAVLDMWARY